MGELCRLVLLASGVPHNSIPATCLTAHLGPNESELCFWWSDSKGETQRSERTLDPIEGVGQKSRRAEVGGGGLWKRGKKQESLIQEVNSSAPLPGTSAQRSHGQWVVSGWGGLGDWVG